MQPTSNLALDSLPEPDRKAFLRVLRPLNLQQGQRLLDAAAPIEKVYFPIDAVVSLLVELSTGERIESVMIGHDGIVGAGAIVSGISMCNAIVRLGGRCLTCEARELRPFLLAHHQIAAHLVIQEQVLLAQSQQSAACNALHSAEERLARMLLRARDLHGSEDLELTQDALGEMLGVRRTTVSLIAHSFQTAGLIRYRRGRIQITDIEGLEQSSCECYATVKALSSREGCRPNQTDT